jgi:hypothetical protein
MLRALDDCVGYVAASRVITTERVMLLIVFSAFGLQLANSMLNRKNYALECIATLSALLFI